MDIRHDEDARRDPVSNGIWPEESLARVPYWVYQDEANYKREMQRLFEAATWNFVCLEADIPNKGDYRTNHVGVMPVIVVRDADGSINCFENRCAHRGALIAFDDGGNVQNNFKCIYHAWSYDLCRQPARHRLRARHQRRGRHAQGFLAARISARASCAPRRCAAWCSPRCRPTRRRSRSISAARCWAASSACSTGRSG